jgi:hypothetical protein
MKGKFKYYEELTIKVLVKDKIHELTQHQQNSIDHGIYLSRRISDLKDILDKL